MSGHASDARAGRILWGMAAAGAGIAGGAAFAAFTIGRPADRLLDMPGSAYFFIGIFVAYGLSVLARTVRGAYRTEFVGIARRLVFAHHFIQFALIVAALIILAAWIPAAAIGTEVRAPLLQALILILVVFGMTILTTGSIRNFACAIRGPAGGSAAS